MGERRDFFILAAGGASLEVRSCKFGRLDLIILNQSGKTSSRRIGNFGTTSEFRMKIKETQENLLLHRRVAGPPRLLAIRPANKGPRDVCLLYSQMTQSSTKTLKPVEHSMIHIFRLTLYELV
jgi:hypothetical protein